MKNVFIYSVLVCIISALSLWSCKDDDDEYPKKVYPTEVKKYTLENASGRLCYNEELKKWAIIPDRESFYVGDEDGCYFIISEMDEQYKQYEGGVVFSGDIVLSYYIKYGDIFDSTTFYYSIDLTSISPSSVQPRSMGGEERLGCGTPSPEPPSWFFTRSSAEGLQYGKSYQFRTFVHVIRNSSGIGFNKEEVSAVILENLNDYYAETNLSFSLLGSEYIDSDYYDAISDKDVAKVFSVNPHSNAIDIYVYSSGRNIEEIAGQANNIPSTACMINSDYYRKPTLAHEVGHCLGLYHTHQGTKDGKNPELANGSNSSVAGDYIVDTPADPCVWDTWNCRYVGTSTDANGDSYCPDPFNIMSYSGFCKEKITQKQIERIYETIKNNALLKAACSYESKEIAGALYINDKATYSVDVPDGYSVNWKITCNTYTNRTGTPTSSYTEALTGKSITLINKNPQASSQKYTLDVTVTTPRGYVMHASKVVYHVQVSGNTGNLQWSSESSSGNFNGTVDLSSSTSTPTAKIYQGGRLYFYYSDISGTGSRIHDIYYDFQLSNTSFFTKMPGINNGFYCKPEATTMTLNELLLISVNGIIKIVPVPVKILQRTNYYVLEKQDSLEHKVDLKHN